jgi:hypothetical protein
MLVSGLQLSIFPLSVNFGPRSVKNQGKMVKILIIIIKLSLGRIILKLSQF